MAATKKKTSNRGKRQTKQEPAAGNFSTEIVLILFLALFDYHVNQQFWSRRDGRRRNQQVFFWNLWPNGVCVSNSTLCRSGIFYGKPPKSPSQKEDYSRNLVFFILL